MYLNRPATIPREEYLAEANKCKALNNQLIGQGSKKSDYSILLVLL